VKVRAIVEWIASVDSFVEWYQVEFKLSTDAEWSVRPKTRATKTNIDDIDPGTYDFRIKSVNDFGVAGDYTTTKTKEITGLLGVPADMTGLTISAVGGMAVLRWDKSTDVDVLIGGTIIFRHDNATTGGGWSTSVSIGKEVPGNAEVASLPLKEGTYLAKFVDSSGFQSDSAASVSTKQATVLSYTNTSSITEHPTFPGTFNNVLHDAGDSLIKLRGSDNMDSWADVDSVSDWDSEGGVVSSGSYEFSASFDFGSVVKKRITTLIEVTIVNVLDLIDNRTDNIDDWADFDGSSLDDADAWVEVRHTDDDPAGTPTWSEWQRLDSAEFEARAFELRLQMRSEDPAFNIHITKLSATADEVA